MGAARRTTAAALVTAGAAALACSGATMTTTMAGPRAVRLHAEPCGGYRAEIDYAGSGVEVLVDGAHRETLPSIFGPETREITGQAPPGAEITVTARSELGAVVEQKLVLPPVRPPVEITVSRGFGAASRVARGADAELEVSPVFGGCSTDDWTWTATLPDGSLHGPHAGIPVNGPEIALPTRGELGERVVKVDFTRADGATWTEEARYELVATTDADRDGYDHADAGGDDCDDSDAKVFPLATERADGKDQDCNGIVDDRTEVYDDDGDGVTERDGDCDDADASRAPNQAETADCRDEDCDGDVDEGVPARTTDDGREPNDALASAWDLGGDPRVDLEIVTRDLEDEEWFRFVTKDHALVDEPLRAIGSIFAGSLDGWRLKVVAHRLPDDAVYRVEFWHGGAKQGSGTLSSAFDKVRMNGSVLRDDTGEWQVRIVPVRAPRPYCPASFRIRAD